MFHAAKLPKWTLPFFVIAMTLSISSSFLISYNESENFGHQMISALANDKEYHNVIWDDFCYIPRMRVASSGGVFSDPWNSYSPNYKGWGSFGLLAPFIGGIFIYIFKNYFIAMTIWGLINFTLIIILLYNIFRARPFEFPQSASILGTFLLLNLLWFGGQTFERLGEAIPKAFFTGYHFSLVELEAGLFTYLPYILFLFFYWRFVTDPCWRKSLFVGGSAGFLTYIYFYHHAFAFSIVIGQAIVSLILQRKKEAAYLAGALGAGLLVATPYIVNSLLVTSTSASLLYMERLDFSPGRSPFQDYHWFLHLQILFVIGVVYCILRKQADIKWIMVRTWGVLGIAYAIVLHLRLFLSFMQAVDHFWRMSLGIPASLWCILAVFDLTRSSSVQFDWGKKVVYLTAVLLPILILVRTTADVGYSMRSQDPMSQLSATQRKTLEELNCLNQILKPGEGFLTVDPALNYHTMVNLRGKPFMAMGLSPISIDELSKRYLLSAYLTGRDNILYPQFGDRKASGYTNAKDLHLYLYVNLFLYPGSNPLEERFKQIYQNWNPAHVDWNIWTDALSTVKAVYLRNEHIGTAMKRLEKLYTIRKIVSCKFGKALRVSLN